jgi:hypothetical protein
VEAPITLPEIAFVVLWERLGLGDLPSALFIPSPGATHEERAETECGAAAALTRAGIGPGGGLTGSAGNALRLLAAPSAEYYGWLVPAGGDAIGLTAATDGRQAVLARLADGFVRRVPVGAQDIAGALCGEIPLAGGTGQGFTVRPGDRRVRELLAPERLGARAQFFVSVTRRGRRLRSAQAIGYAQTGQGNWLFHALAGPDRITAVPGRAEVLAALLGETGRRLAASPPVPRIARKGTRDRDVWTRNRK